MTDKSNIRLGIVGLGYMGRQHFLIWKEMIKSGLVNASIKAICDPDPGRLQTIAKGGGAERTTSNPEEVLSAPDVDAIIIASPPEYHRDQTLLALRSGKAVYCEKPIGVTLAQARELAEAASRSNLPNQTGLVLRHSPSCDRLRELVAGGELGKPVAVKMRHNASYPEGGVYALKTGRIKAGCGILREANVHDIDLLLWVFGDYDIGAAELKIDAQTGVDVAAFVELKFKAGFHGEFVTLWNTIDGWGTRRRLEIVFEKGVVIADDFLFNGPLTVCGAGASPRTLTAAELYLSYLERHNLPKDFNKCRPWYSSIADHAFYQAIASGKPCDPSFAAALQAESKVQDIYDKGKGSVKEVNFRLPPALDGR